MKFRKKPVVIEAMQFDGMTSTACKIMTWAHEGLPPETNAIIRIDGWCLKIRTLEGEMTATDRDWIIKGVKGEFYPCKPDIFAATYEPVELTGTPTRETGFETCAVCGLRWIGAYTDCPGCLAQAGMKGISDLIQERDALTHATGATGWRDIATAPRGTPVLAVMKREPLAAHGEIAWAYWTTATDTPDNEGGIWTFSETGEVCVPTHWMPIPTPPEDRT